MRKSQSVKTATEKKESQLLALRLTALFTFLLAGLLINVCLGEVRLLPDAALKIIASGIIGNHLHSSIQAPPADALATMVWQIRIPRLLAAAIVGAALGTAGYLLQSLSRNYLADPYLTGVSSGAALASTLVIIAGAGFAMLPIAALAGGLAAALVVAMMARTSSGLSITRLLLGGIAVSAACSSLITMIMTGFAEGSRAHGLLYWLAGSVSGRSWPDLQMPTLYIVLATLSAMILSKPLRVLSLGSASAASLGVNVPRMQWAILLTAIVLCGSAVSLSGIVGFVGLVAPYVARSVLANDERIHIIGAATLGATLVLFSDLCARCAIPGQELPLGTLLSLLGAPFFLWLILKHKDEYL